MSDKAIFLDRDDTLIEDPGYINNPRQVKLIRGVARCLAEFRNMGYKLIVVSNQSGIARGFVTEKALGQIHERLEKLLSEKSVSLDRIYYCPYHPDGVIEKFRRESEDRKPNPGMILTAAKEMDIDLSESWMLGNSGRDIEAGQRAGCMTIMIDNFKRTKKYDKIEAIPDYQAVNMKEAVNIIKKHLRAQNHDKTKTQVSGEPVVESTEQSTKIKEQPQSDSAQLTAEPTEDITGASTEQLLSNILMQLKAIHRGNLFHEFSIMRLLAGLVQVIVLICLLISIWFLIGPTRQDNSVYISLGFAVVLQLMSLTFYMMRGRR